MPTARKIVITETDPVELEVITDYLPIFGESTANSFVSEFQRKIGPLEDGMV